MPDCSRCLIKGDPCLRIKQALKEELAGTGIDGSQLCPEMLANLVPNLELITKK